MNHITELVQALQSLDMEQLNELPALINRVRSVRKTVWLCGNGGSFATAKHWATDLSKACGVRAWALGTNSAALTAWANDEGYTDALANELERFVEIEDALIAFSCSGTSPNIVTVLKWARGRRWLETMLLTGEVNEEIAPATFTIRVPSRDYGIIEDCHMAIGHWLVKRLQG